MIHIGIVEDRQSDPMKIGRCKVRVFGVHTPNRADLPTADLPWAMVLLPTTSASIDGIGYGPTGLVEGSTVVVQFADVDKQIPIIMGSLNSIPLKSADPLMDSKDDTVSAYKPPKPRNLDPIITGDGSVLQDSSGNPVTSGYADMNALIISERGLEEIRSSEGLCSLTKGGRKIGNDKTPGDTLIYAYKDTKQIWTIGWGNTYLMDNTKVDENTVITKREADNLMRSKIQTDFAKRIKKNLQVPVTQGMFDALCSMAYNMGYGGLSSTNCWYKLQAGNYVGCANEIPNTKTNGGSLTSRRLREKSLFLADGVPQNVKVEK